MKRKLCSVLLALCMVLTLLPVSAMAEGGTATSLPDAVDGVITLREDVALSQAASITENTVIDLAGHTLSRNGGMLLDIYGDVTIKNGNIAMTNANEAAAIWLNKTAKLTIESDAIVSVPTSNFAIAFYSDCTAAELTVKGTLKGGNGLTVNGTIANPGNKVTVDGATIESDGHGIYQAGVSDIVVKNANITGSTAIEVRAGSMTIESGTFTATAAEYTCNPNGNGTTTEGAALAIAQHTTKKDISVTVNGGTFKGIKALNESNPQNNDPAPQVDLKVVGGTFNGDVSITDNGNTSVTGGTFSDLSALDYLASGATVTVKLAADTTKDVTIPAGATVTLDLNGHKIVNSATAQDKNVAEDSRKHTITNNGTLTILDSVGGGVVDNVSHGRAALYNAGTIVEIKGGKFTRSVDNSTDATSANGNSWYVIYNAEGANITKISSGEFLALGHFSSLFCNSGTINEISGGTFTQDGFIAFKNEGTVNKISGGTFSSESESCIQNWGTIGEISDGTITAGRIGIWNFSSDTYKSAGTISRITGGNISGTTAAIRLNDYDTDYKDSDKNVKGPSTVNKANASISAGNFSGALEVNAHTVLTITGGTYSVDPSAYVVPGYVASYNGSTYTVYYPVPVTPGNTSSSTTKNPDGSTTTTTTDKTTGTVTETTKNPDGSTTTVETKKDGSVTETNKTAGGSVGTVKSDANGNTEISASISAADVSAAAKKNEPVAAPVSVAPAASPAAAPVIKLSVPASAGEVSVVIPVTNAQQGTVAIKVNPDGTEEIIKTSVVTKDGVVLGVKGSTQIKIVNNDKDFSDTVGHWAESDVDFVSARELFTGTAPQTFSPESATTRGMVVTVLARLAGESTDGGANWYDKGCAWAVTNGVSDGTDPNGTVTREQLAAMLYRYFGSPAVSGSLSFADASSVSEYAHDAMQWCVNNGIINGMDGLLNPQGQATRAQVSAMFARYIRLMSTK